MVFQNYALYPTKVFFENIAFGLVLRKHPIRGDKNRVLEAAVFWNRQSYLERKPGELSGVRGNV